MLLIAACITTALQNFTDVTLSGNNMTDVLRPSWVGWSHESKKKAMW